MEKSQQVTELFNSTKNEYESVWRRKRARREANKAHVKYLNKCFFFKHHKVSSNIYYLFSTKLNYVKQFMQMSFASPPIMP